MEINVANNAVADRRIAPCPQVGRLLAGRWGKATPESGSGLSDMDLTGPGQPMVMAGPARGFDRHDHYLWLQERDPTDFSPAERDFLDVAFDQALRVLRGNLTADGFAPCSVGDESGLPGFTTELDHWAVAGAITVNHSAGIRVPEICRGRERTLRVLLAEMDPPSQLGGRHQAQRVDVDHFGLVGFEDDALSARIHAALWTVIALYAHLRGASDLALLEEHEERLHRLMGWLSSMTWSVDEHLEVPVGAGAGHVGVLGGSSSGHVVLWHRANVCYALLMDLGGRIELAAEYMRRARVIAAGISAACMSSDRVGRDRPLLIGQHGVSRVATGRVTPTGGVVDVFANLQLCLSDLVDLGRARSVVRFLWGVGVNEPWPVVNSYPQISGGLGTATAVLRSGRCSRLEDDAPGHYWNGGVWPWLGGTWVRCLHRLGLYSLACSELLRLAEFNRLGRLREWEFNEWGHGRTGRPMGRVGYSASAASFIDACLELRVKV